MYIWVVVVLIILNDVFSAQRSGCAAVFRGSSVEKDGSPLSDEKQTIQTSLFALLKDFLKSPSPEELHCVLAYALSVGEEKQVTFLLSHDL